MAIFNNFATLSYNGGTTNSNTVTGEILDTLSSTKIAVMDDYTANDDATYVITLLNSSTSPMSNVTITDDLGGYAFNETTVYPLEYTAGSVRLYINGVLQAAPTVTAGPPLVFSGISIPAGGNAIIIYEAAVTAYAPLAADDTITNTAVITAPGLSTPVTVTAVIQTEDRADLTISKSVCPAVVSENDQLTYTFVIENHGNTPAAATDNAVLTDTLDPILDPITVTFNGTTLTEGTAYTYDRTTGLFTTTAGQITVPAATYTQAADGTWTITPGTSVLTITGTV